MMTSILYLFIKSIDRKSRTHEERPSLSSALRSLEILTNKSEVSTRKARPYILPVPDRARTACPDPRNFIRGLSGIASDVQCHVLSHSFLHRLEGGEETGRAADAIRAFRHEDVGHAAHIRRILRSCTHTSRSVQAIILRHSRDDTRTKLIRRGILIARRGNEG